MSQPSTPPVDDRTPPSPQPDAAGWAAPSPSWAPAWTPPGAPVAAGGPAPGGPVAGVPVAAPARATGPLALAAAGLLIGMLGSGLVVTALFAVGAESIGREMADRVGSAVEQGIVDGTRQAMEETMDGAMGVLPEDVGFPSGPRGGAEQFPPVPPEELGPDPVLDAYAQQCFDGALQACDDLLYESPPMSDYETYGSTCGGRVKEYALLTCTELE